MGIPLKTTIRRTARGKARKIVTELVPGTPLFFKIPYNRDLHHRVVLDSVRMLVKSPGRFGLRIPRIAQAWHDAILRDAPMLKGFFADEPKWRAKAVRWCEKVLNEK